MFEVAVSIQNLPSGTEKLVYQLHGALVGHRRLDTATKVRHTNEYDSRAFSRVFGWASR